MSFSTCLASLRAFCKGEKLLFETLLATGITWKKFRKSSRDGRF
jgi:hypothetical protein